MTTHNQSHRRRRPPAWAMALACLELMLTSCAATQPTVEAYGAVDNQEVRVYTLRNAKGLLAKITNYGATVTELHAPDRKGRLADIVLGFETLEDYRIDSPYFGAMVGRVANRVAEGGFELDGKRYQLPINNGRHHLHGGLRGFDKVVWDAEPFDAADGPGLRLSYLSRDGEEGYPGNLQVTVTYVLTDANELRIETRATTDAATPVSIAHHGYWNLGGHDSGNILAHQLMLNASAYTPADAELIPLGKVEPVAGTPFDFTREKAIGADIQALAEGEGAPGGYDVNFVVDGDSTALRPVATVYDPNSGRQMSVRANVPGVQLYTGNFLNGLAGKGGATYRRYGGFCLETQHFPNAINVPHFQSPVLRPGETYHHVMVHAFSTRP